MKPDWLEKVWMEVQDEIDQETRFPQKMICHCGLWHGLATHEEWERRHERNKETSLSR